jgi:hypothetical protein
MGHYDLLKALTASDVSIIRIILFASMSASAAVLPDPFKLIVGDMTTELP